MVHKSTILQSGGGGTGTVTEIDTGTGLSGGPITGTGTITSNLSTGVSGGQSVIGGTANDDNLTITSTSSATKGFINFGSTSSYDETNTRLGLLTNTPTNTLTFGVGSTGWADYRVNGTNFEDVVGQWQGTSYTIGTYYGGTAASRPILIGVQSTANSTTLSGARVFSVLPSAASTQGLFDFNWGSTGTTPSLVTVNGSIISSNSLQNIVSIQPTINQSGSAGYNALLISPFESTTGSGNKFLINAGTSTAASGGGTFTSKFGIDDNGNGFSSGSFAIGPSVGSSLLFINRSRSAPAWDAAGQNLQIVGNTLTDTSTAAGATVSRIVASSIASPTITAANATVGSPVIYTTSTTLYISGPPTGGANTTITNPWAILVGNGSVSFPQVLAGGGAIQGNAVLSLSRGGSGANTTTTGVQLAVSGNTYTDTVTSSGGTASFSVANSFGSMILAASNTSVTYTNAATVYIVGPPQASTNVTLTSANALYVASGQSGFVGGINTRGDVNFNTSNFFAGGGTTANSFSLASIGFGGTNNIFTRVGFNGNAASVVTANFNYTNTVIGSSPAATAATGIHALFASQVINPLGTVTNNGASITNTSTLYLNGASSATVTGANYTLWAAAGLNRFDGANVLTPVANPSINNTLWNDSTQVALTANIAGNTIYNRGGFFVATADTTITNTATETSVLGTGIGSKTLAVNTLTAGKTINFNIAGIFSTGLTAGNATVKIKVGTTTVATVTITNLPNNVANLAFQIWGTIVTRTTGTTGTCVINGKFEYETALLASPSRADLNNGGATSTINTTTTNTLDVTWTWATASTSNILKVTTANIDIIA